MADRTAIQKYPCRKCGADAVWNPDKQMLVCPYCGTEDEWRPGENKLGETIIEHDLEQALAKLDEQEHGWKTKRRTVKCQNCLAVSVFDPDRVAQNCEFCGSPQIIDYADENDVITPETILPKQLSEPQVRDILRRWYGQQKFAPDRLKKAALTDTLRGIYLPYWTFDAQAESDWDAMAGHYYYEMQTYVNAQGQRVTGQVQKIRWQPAAGHESANFDDLLVPGTKGVHPELLRQIEPFPTENLVPYEPAYVSGWTVERYQVDLSTAAVYNRNEMDAYMNERCAQAVPGDTYSNLNVHTTYHYRTFKHILVPVWLVSYDYGSRSYQVIVNGYTGQVAGEFPKSWVKIFFYIILPILLVFLLYFLSSCQGSAEFRFSP